MSTKRDDAFEASDKVLDPMNVGHFVTPTEIASFIARNRMSFEQLKAVLPQLDKDEFVSDQKKADMEVDA